MLYTDKIPPIEEILHPDEFTGRVEILREIEHWIKEIGRVGAGSTSLIAPRRMGKTVLLDRLVNIVFYKPEYKVATFYIKFRREEITLRKFLLIYATEFFRQFIAYCLQDPILYRRTDLKIKEMLQMNSENQPVQIAKQYMKNFIDRYDSSNHEDARYHWDEFIKIPEQVAVFTGIRVAIIIDEFQDMKFYVYDTDDLYVQRIQNSNEFIEKQIFPIDLTATFDRTSLSRKAPMLVSGSAVTLIFKTVMGGPLGGRFDFMFLKPLSIADGASLIKNLVKIYTPDLAINFDMGIYASSKVNGHPYYLYCIVTSKYNNKTYDTLEQIDNIIDYEIEYGKIYGFWQTHFDENKEYINNDNDKEIGKKILYYFTKYSDKEVDIEEISKAIGISEAEVEKKIEKLYYADIVHKEKNKYKGFQDICLMKYIQRVYASDIKGKPLIDLSERGKMNFIKGKYLELIVANTMSKFDEGEIVLGDSGEIIAIKAPIMTVEMGYQFKAPTKKTFEIDIFGKSNSLALGKQVWLCECKYKKEKMGISDVKKLQDLKQAYIEHLEAEGSKSSSYRIIRWYISTAGFTKEALEYLATQEDAYYSDYDNVNNLCLQYGLGYNVPKH